MFKILQQNKKKWKYCIHLIHINDTYNLFVKFLYRLPEWNQDLKHDSICYKYKIMFQ